MINKYYEIQVEITPDCLLDCIHCSSLDTRKNGKRLFNNEDLLSTLELFSGEIRLSFTGGEPLLYADLLPLCKKITSEISKASISLYTTGNIGRLQFIDNKLAENMKASGISECYFSIYDDREFVHDSWTGQRGSFSNSIKSIRNIIKAGIVGKAHLVLTRENSNRIEEVIRFCQTLGLKEVRILRLSCAGNAKNHWTDIGIPMATQNRIIQDLIHNKNKYDITISIAGYPELCPCRNFIGAKGCQAGSHLLYINISGDIYPCACAMSNPSKFKICNIKDKNQLYQYLCRMKNIDFSTVCLNSTP